MSSFSTFQFQILKFRFLCFQSQLIDIFLLFPVLKAPFPVFPDYFRKCFFPNRKTVKRKYKTHFNGVSIHNKPEKRISP